MTPYLIFGLAMAGIVIFSLVVTGNLAATFNERAKRDLKAALEPLATIVGGDVDLEDARIRGRFRGQITTGQVVPGPGGMGRLFVTTYVEPAGGIAWKAIVRRPKVDGDEWERSFETEPHVGEALRTQIYALLDELLAFPGWFELAYDPAAGSLKLTRAMQSRRDVPTPERFGLYLQTLERAAAVNRASQGDAAGAAAVS